MKSIRLANKTDSKIIENLLSSLYKPEVMWTRNKIEQRMENGSEYYLLEDSSKTLGVLEIKGNEFTALSVKPKNKGYGTKLIKFGEKILKKRGYSKLFLYTLDYNKAQGFYEKIGYTLEETIPNLVDDQTGYKYSRKLK